MELSLTQDGVQITSEKKVILLSNTIASVDGLDIRFPWEYEKSGILVHTTEIGEHIVYELRIEGRMVAYVPSEITEGTELLSETLANIDVLFLLGNKETVKLSEYLDSRIVVPYGESRATFLATLGQNIEGVEKFKTKEADFDGENTVFVHLA